MPAAEPRAYANIPTTCRERFLTTTPAGRSLLESAGLEYAGLSDLVPPYEMRRWNNWHHVLLFTLAGRAQFGSADGKADLTAGTLCVLPASVDHRYVARGRWQIVWFHPRRTAAWDALMGRRLEIRPFARGRQIAQLAEWLYGELAGADPAAQESARLAFDYLLHELKRELRGDGGDPREREWRRRLDVAWEQAAAEPARWNVDTLAKAVRCSRTHLHVLCRRLYGQGPQERLIHLRMQRAADYLRHTPWSLEQISALVGYADAFAFSKAFRREKGMAPAKFRAQARR